MRVRPPARPFLGLGLLLAALVAWGFWPSYFGPLSRGGVSRPWIIHVHAAVFSGWLVLLLLQAWLVGRDRVRLHRRVGRIGAVYGGLVLAMGLVTSVAAPVLHVRAGEWTEDQAASFLLLPLGDMALFAGLFGGAIAWRRRPEVHKRLILAAAIALWFAAAARIVDDSAGLLYALWLAPLFLAMAADLATSGRVHRVHVASLGVLTLAFGRLFLMDTPGWRRVGRAVLAMFL